MFTSLKNKIREETGNDVCVTLPTLSTHRRNSLILNNLNNNNNNVEPSQNGSVTSPSLDGGSETSSNSHRFSTKLPPQFNDVLNQKNAEIADLTDKLNESDSTASKLLSDNEKLLETNARLEKSNKSLADALKVAQEQKELIHDEQDKIQNLQAQETSKLKSLLHFRESVSFGF